MHCRLHTVKVGFQVWDRIFLRSRRDSAAKLIAPGTEVQHHFCVHKVNQNHKSDFVFQVLFFWWWRVPKSHSRSPSPIFGIRPSFHFSGIPPLLQAEATGRPDPETVELGGTESVYRGQMTTNPVTGEKLYYDAEGNPVTEEQYQLFTEPMETGVT